MDVDAWRERAAAGEAPDVDLRKAFIADQVKAVKDSRRITFTISTGAVDRQGDTIAVDGWKLDNYLKNPVVLFAHRYDQLPVAKAISLVKEAGALKATAEFPEKGLYPLADTVYEMLKAGFLRATSVGFRPLKSVHNEERPGWAMDFIEQELLEFSVVPVPCNPEALMDAAKGVAGALSAGVDLAPLEQAIALAKSVTKEFGAATTPEHETAEAAEESPVGAPEPITKSGRRFSAANEKRIRDAYDMCTKANAHLQELVDQMAEAMDDEPEPEPEKVVTAPVEKAPDQPAPPAPLEDVVTFQELAAGFEAALQKAMTAGTSGQGANA